MELELQLELAQGAENSGELTTGAGDASPSTGLGLLRVNNLVAYRAC